MNWLFRLWIVGLLALAATPGVASADGKPATKIADDLVVIALQHAEAVARGIVFRSADPFVRAADDWVIIDAVAAGDPGALAAELRGLGAQNIAIAGRIVSARLPISAISVLDTLVTLRFAQPAYAATNAGLVTSQGDRAMHADIARGTFGVTGTGVKVGVLSDSFNCRGGAASDVASGDLSPVTVILDEPGCASGTDEGRAMLQIVHDVAPGASLAFATGFAGTASFAANIRALATAGARVIVDDVGVLDSPMFQDGVIAQAVDAVVAQGVTYFSAAGNEARLAYDSAFVPGAFFPAGAFPGNPAFLGGTVHLFGGINARQRITVPAGSGFRIVLQWDSPFFSVSGIGTTTDLDIYLFDANSGRIVSGSTRNNITSGDPVEIAPLFNNGLTAADAEIMIVNRSGPNPGRIKYVVFPAGNFPIIQQFATNSGTIYGHANAQGAIAVGAADYRQTPAFGVNPPILEPFSSGGTTPILFDTAGTRRGTPDPRANKPQIVAPDRVDTTFFFPGYDPDGSSFPNFPGTSAAAPHAAAVAALMLQAVPTMTPAQVLTTLESTALDMGSPGFDNDSGFGLIQADAALSSLAIVTGITPNAIDLVSPPTTFTITGQTFADRGLGLPVVNFIRNGTVLGQARATAIAGSTSLTVPFPTNATSLIGPLPGLSADAAPVNVQVYNQTGPSSYALVGSTTLIVADSRPPAQVNSITPNSFDLANPLPATFTITGQRFADTGFGRPVVNFMRNGVLLGQARATALGGNTSLTVPFPTNATSLNGPLPGLSFGAVLVQAYNQTGPSSYVLIGGITLDVSDSRPCTPPCVSSITPSSIDLLSPPATFTIAGGGFADSGSGLPVVNFIRNGVVLGQARATAMTGGTSLTVPFPTNATSLIGALPGLSADAAPVNTQVYNQIGPSSYALVGSTTLTVADSRPPAQVNSITPNSIDLASAPATFTLAGQRFADTGFGRPVVNFMRNGVLLGQARATALGGSTSLSVPFPTNATSLNGPLPGLSFGAVLVQAYNQTGPSSYVLIGGITLDVTDSRPCTPPCVSSITPSSIDLLSPPATFTIAGGGFADSGSGLPVVNFIRNGVVLGQARATAMTGGTSLTVPFPTNATSLIGPLPGLSADAAPVNTQVYNQTGPSSYALVGSTTLIVADSRPPAQVNSITPNSFDLANPLPATFTITGQRFADTGFGRPVVNFMRNGVLLGQARATALGGSTSLTVPFPTNATSLNGPLPGLSVGDVLVQVYNQTGTTSYVLVGGVTLTVQDSRPPQVTSIAPNSIDLATSPPSFTIAGQRFSDNGFGRPVVNFMRAGVLLGQARATAMVGSTSLTVPFPTNATSISGPLLGLSAGTVDVQVYNQTGPGSYMFVGNIPLTVTDSRPAQVRFLNNLLICNPGCQPFTAQLTAQEGYTWLSFSGVYSDYQPVTTPTLSNFRAVAIGFGATLSFPETFTIARGQRYALIGTLDVSNNVVLLLVSEGPLGAASQELSVTKATLLGQQTSDGTIHFAPAEAAPAHR